MNHAKHHPSLWQRGLSALLALAFAAAELAPSAAYAQGDETRARVRRLRELNEARQRAAAPSAPAPAPVPEDAADTEDAPPPPAFSPRAIASEAGDDGDSIWQFNLVKDAPLDALLDMYSQVTGRTMIKAPGVNATFPNIKVKEKLTKSEMLQVMDSLLSMNNISLVPLGSRFYRVVQIDKASTEGMAIQTEVPEGGYPESDALVSQLIRLKYLGMEDANNIVGAMLHGYGKVQRLDRINSLLVLETSTNLRRINDILEMVDQPTELNVETSVYVIRHAKAADIAARLNELASESEQKEEVARVANPLPRRMPSMMRARQPATPAEDAQPSAASTAATAAEKGIIQGKVKILTDERTNIIIVITNPVNLPFFNMIVNALDVSVDPEVEVQVVNLEFADAEEMASLLNNFIGASSSSSDSGNVPGGGRSTGGGDDSRAQALENFVRARASAADRNAAKEAVAKIGQLSSDTKILADTRTNTILLMGTKGDIAALLDVIKKVDIMLAQVLIEAVILEVNLNNNSSYGISWLQKSMTAYNAKNVNGISVKNPVVSWGGTFGGGNKFASVAGDNITRASTLGTSGLSYFFTFTDLNMDAVLEMVASSGEGRVLATPVILTTDNTEASIISGQSVPVRTGDSSYSSGTYYGTYEYKDVGIELKVKPRINPSRYVTLEISQSANTLGDQTDVGNGSTMYKINKRELTASISLPSRSTIVLGGLVETDYSSSESHIPILGSIPILGALFRNESKTRQRTELLVLITPYVLMTPEEARAETERLHRASNVAAEDWYRGWSDSSLAPFSPAKLKEMRKKEKAKQEGITLRTLDDEAAAVSSPSFSAPVAVIPSDAAPDTPGDIPELAPEDGDSPLPAPESPVSAAPFTFDAAAAAAFATPADEDGSLADSSSEDSSEAPSAVVPRRSLFGHRSSTPSDPKPSMFPAPDGE